MYTVQTPSMSLLDDPTFLHAQERTVQLECGVVLVDIRSRKWAAAGMSLRGRGISARWATGLVCEDL